MKRLIKILAWVGIALSVYALAASAQKDNTIGNLTRYAGNWCAVHDTNSYTLPLKFWKKLSFGYVNTATDTSFIHPIPHGLSPGVDSVFMLSRAGMYEYSYHATWANAVGVADVCEMMLVINDTAVSGSHTDIEFPALAMQMTIAHRGTFVVPLVSLMHNDASETRYAKISLVGWTDDVAVTLTDHFSGSRGAYPMAHPTSRTLYIHWIGDLE